jgi:hypothetical protein
MEQVSQRGFLRLASSLSPENIWMDGEATPAQAKKRIAELRRQWRALEVTVGRKVSEDEVWHFEGGA